MRWLLCLLLGAVLFAADNAADLISAAAKGDVARIESLLRTGANVEAKDKDGRTALMIAAQHGRSAAVKALLAAGAKANARDNSGTTAYGLALFEPVGHGDRDATLEALPKPPRLRLAMIAGWSAARLVSSCFQQREQIVQRVGLLKPEESLLRKIAQFAKISGKGMAELVSVDARNIQPLEPQAAEGADGIALVEILPGSACSGGAGDTLTFEIDLQIYRAQDRRLLLHKTLGGGFKGMRAQTIANANQYQPIYETWMKQQAGPVFWAAVEALMRSPQ